MPERLIPTGIYFDNDTIQLLKFVAALQQRSVSDIVRTAVLHTLATQLKPNSIREEMQKIKTRFMANIGIQPCSGMGEHLVARGEHIATPEFFSEAKDVLFAGRTLSRVTLEAVEIIYGLLENGANIRFLLMHPDNPIPSPRESILVTLDRLKEFELEAKFSQWPGNISVRLHHGFLGYSAIRAAVPSNTHLLMELLPYGKSAEERPQFMLTPRDEPWFSVFDVSLMRLWDDSHERSNFLLE